ncbi:MAG: hypothetical protein DMF63_15790 [Acidobacteria bacterium]|nr:MAG: hypothetical protein DMF63_15790 [Acidobacteriota bacterium]
MSLVFTKWASISLCLIVLCGSARFAGAQVLTGETKISELVIVNVRADKPSQEIKSLVEMLKVERAKGPAELNVDVVHGPTLNIPPEPRESNNLDVKPDPLLLTVTVGPKGNVELNSEKLGSLLNVEPLTKLLVKVFKDREVNGVFREDTNDVEKTVRLRLDPALKVSDLEKIAIGVDEAGSDRIVLLIDPPDTLPSIDTIFLPQVPSRKRKRH